MKPLSRERLLEEREHLIADIKFQLHILDMWQSGKVSEANQPLLQEVIDIDERILAEKRAALIALRKEHYAEPQEKELS